MISNSQKLAIEELESLASSGRQSILIEGPPGCGKTYLSQRFANMVNVTDYYKVLPKVSEIREALDKVTLIDSPVVLEIENLDLGVLGASYTLLKSLEEPLPHVYIVITCRNMEDVPDTIISRSAVVNVSPPTPDDIDRFGHEKDRVRYDNVKSRLVWQCVRSFTDASEVLEMTLDEVNYYESLAEVCKFRDTISNTVWKIGHYDSNKECNVELAIRSIAELMKKPFITKCSIDCIRDLNSGRIASHAVLSKFVFDAKYCE